MAFSKFRAVTLVLALAIAARTVHATEFDGPFEVLSAAAIKAVGCRLPDTVGSEAAGRVSKCRARDDNGLPPTVDFTVFERDGSAPAHAFLSWKSGLRGMATEADHKGAETAARSLLGHFGIADQEPILRAFLGTKTGGAKAFRRGALRVFVEVADEGIRDHRLFVGPDGFRQPE